MELFFMMQIHWIISIATYLKPIHLVKNICLKGKDADKKGDLCIQAMQENLHFEY